jgi:hypothetical protein
MLAKFAKHRFLIAVVCATLISLAWSSPSRAQLLDPSTLHVFNGTDPGTGPNPLGGNGALTITEQSGGAKTINPLLLIIGIPNDPTHSGGTAGSPFYGPGPAGSPGTSPIQSVTTTVGTATWQLGGPPLSPGGGVWNPSSGFGTLFNAANGSGMGQDVYTALGLQGEANASNNFGNWVAGETAGQDSPFPPTNPGVFSGITSFSLYVFELTFSNGFSGGQSATVQFATGELPVGAYAVAYGVDSNAKAFSTPFTEAGVEQSGPNNNITPAPPSVVLLGIGIALFGCMTWSRRRSPAVAA